MRFRDPWNRMRPARVMWRVNRLSVTLALGISLLVSACSAGSGPGGSAPPAGDTGLAIEHPTGSDLVVRMESGGGFVPREFVLGSLPAFTLLGDGRVITQGAQTMIFPGPALPSIQERRLSEAGIQQVLDFIRDTGLFGADAEYMGAANVVADAPTTTFTVQAGGRTVTVSVYALGMFLEGEGAPGLPAGEEVAHRRLQQLSDRLTMLERWLPDEAWVAPEHTDYQPEAVRLYVRNADADPADPSGLEPDVRDWPLAEPLAEFGDEPSENSPDLRCGTIEGPDLEPALAELRSASQITRWRSGESVYVIIARPLLPDEPSECPF